MSREVPAVAFFGRAGSGKTTAARVLGTQGWCVVSLAGPIKQMLAQLPGVTEEHLAGPRKEEPLPLYGRSAREMLQTLGTEWRDTVHPDLWLRLWRQRVDDLASHGLPAVCDDGRFAREVEYLRARGVRCILVRRPSADARPVTHSSEALDASSVEFDAVLDNDLDPVGLELSVLSALRRLGVHTRPQRRAFA